jgi:hypothetical protein
MAMVCEQSCHDLTAAGASSCRQGFKCGIGCSPSGGVTRCTAAGALRSGSCTSDEECAVGFSCVGESCQQACVTNADCTMGGACVKEAFCGSTPSGFHYCG